MNLIVCIVTLGQRSESLRRLLGQLREQTLEKTRYQVIVWQKTEQDVNEYSQMNRAIEAAKSQDPEDVVKILGDDCEIPDREFLDKGLACFADPKLMVMTNAVEGGMWGAWSRDDRPYLSQGTSQWVRRKAWEAVGKFRVDWGLGVQLGGWRSDTCMTWDIIDKFGEDSYLNNKELTVIHRGQARTLMQPLAERIFWREHKKRIKELILPMDPREAQLVYALETWETDREAIEIADKVTLEYVEKGLLTDKTVEDSIDALVKYFEEFDKSRKS